MVAMGSMDSDFRAATEVKLSVNITGKPGYRLNMVLFIYNAIKDFDHLGIVL